MATTNQLQLLLHNAIENDNKTAWRSTLIVDNVILTNDKGFFNPPTTLDICQYLPGGELNDTLPEDVLIRFDASVYPTTDTDNAFKTESYIKLRNNLQRCAIECGYSIVPRGCGKFCCKCYRTYKNASNRKK
jgi:hypothetical protein